MTAPVIRCSKLTKRFDSVLAVDSVDLEIWPGEVIAILGRSGCGKTTLLRLMAGLDVPSDGSIQIEDEVVSTVDYVRPPEERGIGMVVQEYALFPHMTAASNVGFGLRNLDRDRRDSRVAEVLELVQLEKLGNRHPFELSGGQQQRVALARTLAPNPVTVLLDEPLSNLDSSMRQQLRQEVETILRSQRTAAVLVTHDREEAFAIADRVGVMIDGKLLQVDTPERIYHFPASRDIAALTGSCDFIPGKSSEHGDVSTELGTLNCRSAAGRMDNGQPVSVLVRPDDVALMHDADGQGVVEAREFRGDQVILTVRLNSGATIRSRLNSYSTLPAGSRVSVSPVKTIPFVAYPADSTSTQTD